MQDSREEIQIVVFVFILKNWQAPFSARYLSDNKSLSSALLECEDAQAVNIMSHVFITTQNSLLTEVKAAKEVDVITSQCRGRRSTVRCCLALHCHQVYLPREFLMYFGVVGDLQYTLEIHKQATVSTFGTGHLTIENPHHMIKW